MPEKTYLNQYSALPMHWIGDGFPVQTLVSCDQAGAGNLSPFLALDYAMPHQFDSSADARGVGAHPHHGFEAVTLVYQGELLHRDSKGGEEVIGAGDVQWMTAGAGIVLEELHSPAFTDHGGTMEMVQLWINLPTEHKQTAPAYQTLMAQALPEVEVTGGTVRVIAGQFHEIEGIAQTFTDINLWDMTLVADSVIKLPVPQGHNASLAILDGSIWVEGRAESIPGPCVIRFSQSGAGIRVHAQTPTRCILMSGTPINEPAIGLGRLTTSSSVELEAAIQEYRQAHAGKSHSRSA